MADFLRFSLASHLSSLAVLRFIANWPLVSSIMRRYWCSRWHWKSLRYLQKTEVLASLQFGGRLFSLKMNSSCVCVLVLHFYLKGLYAVCVCVCQDVYNWCILTFATNIGNISIFIDGVALNEWSLFLRASNGPLESWYWKAEEDADRQVSVISTCLLLAVINITTTRHLSPAIAGLLWSMSELGNLIRDTKGIILFTLNFIVPYVRMSWAVQPCPCSNVLMHVRYTEVTFSYCQGCRCP